MRALPLLAGPLLFAAGLCIVGPRVSHAQTCDACGTHAVHGAEQEWVKQWHGRLVHSPTSGSGVEWDAEELGRAGQDTHRRAADATGWLKLFDGKSLKGWTPKIKGYALRDNFGNTFRVKDGVIQVGYEAYGGEFKGRFGHLFHETPRSNYIFRCEYRFTGEQVKDGPGWAWRNSGVMIHGQSPESMGKDQDFPVSAEVQLLGGGETGERHTGNLCTPGTNVVINGKLVTQHCTDSNSPTFRGDQWVRLEIEVHGNGKIVHRINGQEVISYSEVQLDPNDASAKPLIKDGKLAISGGSISLQSESHPVEFRNIEIKSL